MRGLQIVLGVFFLLLALFTGGCALIFLVIFVRDVIAGQASLLDAQLLLLLVGLVAGTLIGVLAVYVLRGGPDPEPPSGGEG